MIIIVIFLMIIIVVTQEIYLNMLDITSIK